MKYIRVQQMHINYIDIFLMYYGHQHVSATLVAIFRVFSLRTGIQISITQESPKYVGNHNIGLRNKSLPFLSQF